MDLWTKLPSGYEKMPTIEYYKAEKKLSDCAFIILPGGGYTHYGEQEASGYAKLINTWGIDAFVVRYSLSPMKFPHQLNDARRAVQLVRNKATEYQINPDKIVVIGSSAGGHLASTAVTHFMDDTRLDFQILFYPVITMKEYTHQGSKKNLLGKEPNEELVNLYSNELQVKSQTPPAFIMHSSDDKVVPVCNSVNYYMALTDKGILSSLHLYPIGGHGWGFGDNFIYKRQWTGELEKWLREIKNKQ